MVSGSTAIYDFVYRKGTGTSNATGTIDKNGKELKIGDRVKATKKCGGTISCSDTWEKIEDSALSKIMNLKEKFVLSLTPEPKKSFRKAGITDGDDVITEDGAKVFLTYLLHNKFSAEFKKEVVDDILKDKEKEEKK